MNYEYFIPESPKTEREITEEEILESIFPSKLENIENFDEINIESCYYINNPKSQISDTKNESVQNEAMNAILLIDDYDAVFNKLEGNLNQNEIEQENELKNNYNENYNSNYYNINYLNLEKEDYKAPFFVKNVVKENKYFCPIKNENGELIINVEESNKKCKYIKEEINSEPIDMDKEIIKKSKKKQDSKKKKKKKEPNNHSSTRGKRGPYKKKPKIVQQINTEDKCFPFTTAKGFINYAFPILQTTNLSYYEDYSLLNENENYNMSYNQEKIDYRNKEIDKEKKQEDSFFINEQMNNDDEDINWWKFTTKKYFIAEDGKKKRIKKKRKFKPDDIRKKIKARFHKTIKNIINENLKKAGSNELFDFIPQCFIGNISKKVNFNSFDLTYKEILSTDYINLLGKSDYINKNIDKTKLMRNKEVLKYLENNPEICKRSGFDIIQNMKYKDLLKIYFISAEFENSINQLKDENESLDYIQEYTYRAKTYVKFYTTYENEKKNEINLNNDKKGEEED